MRSLSVTVAEMNGLPGGMMLGSADLIAFVPTRDPTKAREFYEQTLGLEFLSADPFALVFNAHGTTLRIEHERKRIRTEELQSQGLLVKFARLRRVPSGHERNQISRSKHHSSWQTIHLGNGDAETAHS